MPNLEKLDGSPLEEVAEFFEMDLGLENRLLQNQESRFVDMAANGVHFCLVSSYLMHHNVTDVQYDVGVWFHRSCR